MHCIKFILHVNQIKQNLQIHNLCAIITSPQAAVDGNVINKSNTRVLPQTNLVSHGFLKRAFAVWSHFFVAHLIITIILGTAYACFMMVVFGSLLGSQKQQTWCKSPMQWSNPWMKMRKNYRHCKRKWTSKRIPAFETAWAPCRSPCASRMRAIATRQR